MQNKAEVKKLGINKMASLTEVIVGRKELDISVKKV